MVMNGTEEDRRAARRAHKSRVREEAIDRLVREAAEVGGPNDRAYWALVYDLELAPLTTNRAQLAEIGIAAPPPDSLNDAELSACLRAVIAGLAEVHTYLLHTNHLSDRELYGRLAASILDEPIHEILDGSGGREFIDLVGASSPQETSIYLRFYAGEEERRHWPAASGPLPPHEEPPFDRDRHLPRPPE